MVRKKRQRGPTDSAQALSSLVAAVGNGGIKYGESGSRHAAEFAKG